jgi:hypothetical protein
MQGAKGDAYEFAGRDELTGRSTSTEIDTAETRHALFHNISDVDYETRMEAVVGLATRQDLRAIPVILSELETGTPAVGFLEAATVLPRPEYCAALLAILGGIQEGNKDPDSYWAGHVRRAAIACGCIPRDTDFEL